MRNKTSTLLLLLAVASATAIVSAKAAPAERFNGTYDWSDGGSDELSVSFTPDGDDGWKVEFNFRFSGKQNEWKGSAVGSLEDGGRLEGTSGWRGRDWEWVAEVKDGVMRGSHAEIRGNGERYETGTFELRR